MYGSSGWKRAAFILFLCVVIVVLSWMNFTNYKLAHQSKQPAAVQDSDESAEKKALTDEIQELRSRLEAKNNNNEEKVGADMKIFISAYYDNDNSKITAKDRQDNLKPLMTNDGYKQIDIYSDGNPESIDVKYKYTSKATIQSLYFKALDTTHTQVFAICELDVTTVSGHSTSTILMELKSAYDAKQNRWLVDKIIHNNVVNLNETDLR